MYAFAQRQDTKAYDEPLYAYYLKNHPEAHKYHPGSDEILNNMENDGLKVVDMILSANDKPVLFFKHMTHHLMGLDRRFMKQTINIILTRDPKDMLPSFDKVIQSPTIDDVGYALHIELLEYFKIHHIPFVVLDAQKVLYNPEKTMRKLCDYAKIPFDKNMMSWSPQQREEDGIWAKYWYKTVHKSNGFLKYQSKDTPFPIHLNGLLKQCQPYYNKLLEHAI
jgi:hypothetical protein